MTQTNIDYKEKGMTSNTFKKDARMTQDKPRKVMNMTNIWKPIDNLNKISSKAEKILERRGGRYLDGLFFGDAELDKIFAIYKERTENLKKLYKQSELKERILFKLIMKMASELVELREKTTRGDERASSHR